MLPGNITGSAQILGLSGPGFIIRPVSNAWVKGVLILSLVIEADFGVP